ncbi:MAG: hypothetical protein FJW38_20840 [Acidobacteria bacterium]|nr:hypothetical protein [Acidobacteriota bacterium]
MGGRRQFGVENTLTKLTLILLTTFSLLAQRERVKRESDRPLVAAEPPANIPEGELSPRAGGSFGRYAVVFEQDPVAATRESMTASARQRVLEGRSRAKAAVAARGAREFGSAEVLVNAVFVESSDETAKALREIPGVKYVQEIRGYRLKLNKAHDVIRTAQAWTQFNGQPNAGAGVKIGIIDSGIDHNHPMMRDASLTMPAGYPKCAGDDCNYTNSKVIAARSYVDRLVYAFDGDTRPDDLSPRDRVGHGTAAASAAAGAIADTPLGRTSGVAPKAYLGNYKVFGSPGVNDITFDDTIIAALEAALLDGMDIVSMSLGGAALWSPEDRGRVCMKTTGVACDLQVEAVENAIRRGLVVVVSAGNEGELGLEVPSLNTIGSPGTAPSAITVGASVNGHILYQTVRAGNLPRINAYFGNGPRPGSPLQAAARDVAQLDNTGRACGNLAAGSLAGRIALIQRGDCAISIKVNNAQKAGAVGVVVYQQSGNGIFTPGGLSTTGIPAVIVGKDNGAALVQFANSNPNGVVTLDPALTEINGPAVEVAIFSSQGPTIGTYSIKPEVVAVGTDLLLATQTYDPNGDMYDASGYTRAEGTSFSAPLVAGTAALVKQRNSRLTPAQVKSAVVNTADPDIDDFDYDGDRVKAYQSGIGAGQLDVARAVRANVAAEPATVSFGVPASFPRTAQIRFVNTGTAAVNLRFSVAERVKANGVTVAVSPTTATVNANQTVTVTLTISGTKPTASNWYEGSVVADGGAVQLRVPYAYFVGDSTVFNLLPLTGLGFVGVAGNPISRLNLKAIDKQGVPVDKSPVRFRVVSGGGSILEGSEQTDVVGIADGRVRLGASIGQQVFSAETGGKTVEFIGRAIQQPVIQNGGVVNAASGQAGNGLAPGSYISIFGAALSDATVSYSTTYLPVSLANISVGLDVPGARKSQAGRLHFVSAGQINLQIPWELAGESSVNLKVSYGDHSSAFVRVPLNDHSPAAFEFNDPGSGRLMAAALDENFALITSGNGVRRGSGIAQIYANGLGPVTNTPPSGEPAPSQPLATCRVQPEVTIGGRAAAVQFCGLAPGFVGLYQLNVSVPADAPTGVQPLIIRAGGVASKTSAIAVR